MAQSQIGNVDGVFCGLEYQCNVVPRVIPSANIGALGSFVSSNPSLPILELAPATYPTVPSPVQSTNNLPKKTCSLEVIIFLPITEVILLSLFFTSKT